jgi:hypothetical protein
MDTPVMIAMTALMLGLLLSAAVVTVKAEHNWLTLLGVIVLLGAAAFIAYGLDTQCDEVVYRNCASITSPSPSSPTQQS